MLLKIEANPLLYGKKVVSLQRRTKIFGDMFTILRKNFGGRVGERYFKSWETAQKEMLKDIEDCCKSLNGEVTQKWDYFNSSKGFYVFEQEATFENGENCHWSLIDGYFED